MVGSSDLVLVGDVGATKTTLALTAESTGPRDLAKPVTYRSTSFPSFKSLATEYLAGLDRQPDRACIGVPGPVIGGRAKLTNLPWTVDQESLAAELRGTFGLRSVRLLNDVHATAAAVPQLRETEIRTIQTGSPVPGGAIAVLAPGTGIGQAFLTWDGARYRAHPSEGGHSHFSPVTSGDGELWDALRVRFGRVSAERVSSGSGIPNIYGFLQDSARFDEPEWFAEALAGSGDPTATIVDAALDKSRPCQLCRETLEVFVRCLAVEAANLAIKVLATGGVYLAGGIPPRIGDVLASGGFIESFRTMGRYADLMQRIPVHVVLNPQTALLGAAYVALEERS